MNDWWLSPNWLRWAWLVLEQEMVMNVVDDPFKEMCGGIRGNLKMTNLLYIPVL